MKNGKMIIITNNPQVNNGYTDRKLSAFKGEVRFREGKSQTEVMTEARDLIYLGARLLIHPMMGRIKPHETPYKSVLLEVDENTGEGTPETDFESVVIIEDSIRETEKLLKNSAYIKYYDEIDDDLQLLDKLLLDSGIDEIVRR